MDVELLYNIISLLYFNTFFFSVVEYLFLITRHLFHHFITLIKIMKKIISMVIGQCSPVNINSLKVVEISSHN